MELTSDALSYCDAVPDMTTDCQGGREYPGILIWAHPGEWIVALSLVRWPAIKAASLDGTASLLSPKAGFSLPPTP